MSGRAAYPTNSSCFFEPAAQRALATGTAEFQIAAGLQARRRLGLTATLVREDGCEDDVFALIGPKCADVDFPMGAGP